MEKNIWKIMLDKGKNMSKPLGQKIDCDVCIAKAGQPCFIQTSADQHRRTGDIYTPGSSFFNERYHIGSRTQVDTSVNDLQPSDPNTTTKVNDKAQS